MHCVPTEAKRLCWQEAALESWEVLYTPLSHTFQHITWAEGILCFKVCSQLRGDGGPRCIC